MSQPVPTAIRRVTTPGAAAAVEITWSDGAVAAYPARLLRDACPCATCREERVAPAKPQLLPVLTAAEVRPLEIVGMKPVGQYAYSIEFSDGHSSGIYTLEYLRELA
ncbi:MAG: gamma-butyrobetaine hydroxylase-like domain-containing protein [Pirellulales bacterium]